MALAARKLPTEEYAPQEQLEEVTHVAQKRGVNFSFLRRPVFVSSLIAVLVAVVALKLVGMHAQIARYQREQNTLMQEIAQLQNVSSKLDMEIQHNTLQPEVMARGAKLGLIYPPADKIHVVNVPATAELLQPGVTPVESHNWLVNSGRRAFAALSGTMSRLSNGTDAASTVR